MDYVSSLSRSSSSMSYNGSSLSDAGNKATPSSSTSRHVHRDKGQLVAAFPVLKLEADIQNHEGGVGEEGKNTLQEASDGLLSPTFSTCNRKHGYSASCASAQPLTKLARAGTFNGFSSKHGIEESSLPPNCLLPLRDGTASSNCNDNGHISSSFVLSSSDIVGATENAGFSFYGDCSHLPFLSSMDRNKSKTSIHGPIVPPQPTLITNLSGAAPNNVFSAGQLNEFTQQVYIFKYLAAGMNPPPDVLFPLIVSRPMGLPQIGCSAGGFGFSRGGIDREPGRCRRTDGKKWRCSRDAVPDQKYCERHMNRGRNRSKTKNNAGDAAMVTVNGSALTIDANPSSKRVVPTVKLAKSTAFGGESGLQFSLETPCRTPLQDMNKPLLCVDAASIYTFSGMPSSSCMPLSASKIQMTHNLFNRSTPSTISVEDTKPLDAEPLVRSTPLPFQCLTGRSDDKSSPLEFRSTKSPSRWYEDAQRIKCLSSTDLLIQNRSAGKFDVEEEFLENEESVSNWVPISWEATPSLTGGPLMEVVRPNGKEGGVGDGHHHHKLGSPTDVHRVPFVSCSDSSSSASSPRSSALRTDCCLVRLCDVL